MRDKFFLSLRGHLSFRACPRGDKGDIFPLGEMSLVPRGSPGSENVPFWDQWVNFAEKGDKNVPQGTKRHVPFVPWGTFRTCPLLSPRGHLSPTAGKPVQPDPYVRTLISRFVARIRVLRYLNGWGELPQ